MQTLLQHLVVSPWYRFRWRLLALATAASAACPLALVAQRGSIAGVVRDSAGNPIIEADVSIISEHLLSRTDNSGTFVFSRVGAGPKEVAVRRLGFSPRTIPVDVRADTRDTLVVV